ncbi:MAG: hypothetical protein IPI83_14420 [Sphingomonadales bacterium]|nr:hypothetical protein [Sphingomonadales bacterium]
MKLVFGVGDDKRASPNMALHCRTGRRLGIGIGGSQSALESLIQAASRAWSTPNVQNADPQAKP